jgi:23S rRNA (guanosine2251-2'-O)-methyltransferase
MKAKQKEIAFLQRKSKLLGFDIEYVESKEIDALATGLTHGGIVAICEPRQIYPLKDNFNKLSKNGFYVMLEGVEDPYNFGYSVRSIYASGADGIILSERNWMEVAGIVAKSSAGASERIPMYLSSVNEAQEIFRSLGYPIVAAGIRDSVSMYDADLKKPVFLIVGGEKRGISASLLAAADTVVRVEYGREFKGSLSTASAATLLSYEVFRQNRNK